MNRKRIIFVDKISVVDAYINNKINKDSATFNNDDLFIGLNPHTFSYLKRRGLFALNTSQFFKNSSHVKALESSKELVGWLEKRLDFTGICLGTEQCYKNLLIYYFRFAAHYCIWLIEIILNVIEEYHPKIIFASMSNGKISSDTLFEPEENFLGYIVNLIASYKMIKFENIQDKELKTLSISGFLCNLQDATKFVLRYSRFKIWENQIKARKHFDEDRPLLFSTKFFQMDKLAVQVKEIFSARKLYFLPGEVIPNLKHSLLIKLFWRGKSEFIKAQREYFGTLLSSIKNESELFLYRGISFSEVVSYKIDVNISEFIIGFMLWTLKLEQAIDLLDPEIVLSNANRVDDVALAEICNKRGIRTILISHGSHVRPKNESEKIEWGELGRTFLRAPFKFTALQSPLAEGYLEVFPSQIRAVKTGPLIWGKPIKIDHNKKLLKKMLNTKQEASDLKVILHAGTPKGSNFLRFCVYETPDEYLQALCDLADAVEKIPNVILIMKFRPIKEISIKDLKSIVPFSDKIILSVNEPFNNVLGITDLLVSFSSTTIEEALQNGIPVLLYGGDGRYQHVPACEISPQNSTAEPSAVYHVSRAGNLEYSIRHILNLSHNKNIPAEAFDSYIYPEYEKVSLSSLLKTESAL